MTKAKHVQLMLGTGTLANDAIALQLRSLKGKGLVLTNGEFGNRLVGHVNEHNYILIRIKRKWESRLFITN